MLIRPKFPNIYSGNWHETNICPCHCVIIFIGVGVALFDDGVKGIKVSSFQTKKTAWILNPEPNTSIQPESFCRKANVGKSRRWFIPNGFRKRCPWEMTRTLWLSIDYLTVRATNTQKKNLMYWLGCQKQHRTEKIEWFSSIGPSPVRCVVKIENAWIKM